MGGLDARLRAAGDWLMRHQRTIQAMQWAVVTAYLVLLVVPVFLPLPTRLAHIWSNVTLFSQFVFWGIWWPFVLVSMVLVGRLWCGLLCPEGALTEAASRLSRGHAIPRWIRWKGWPFVAFACTTIYGQMVSVYSYPKPTLVILGFSTIAAVGVAWFYGRNKRVWCRYLCPVSGVFGILAKLAPVHYRVEPRAWDAWKKTRGAQPGGVNCAPFVPIRTMRGASACHMCGRCSGFRGAVTLARRSPNHEIVRVAGRETRAVESWLILFGLLGIAAGAFHWSDSALYVSIKQAIAGWLVERDLLWPLATPAPWWVLTNYPDQNDVLTLLDGAVLLGYILAAALVIGGGAGLCVAVAARLIGPWSWKRFHHLVQSLIPLAGCGVFLGLSMTTVTMLRQEGLDLGFVAGLRGALLLGAALWSMWLAWQIAALHANAAWRRLGAMAPMMLAVTASGATWAALFWKM